MTNEQEGRELVFRPNHHGEQVLLAAAMVGPEFRKAAVARHPPDRFLIPAHRAIWGAIKEAERRGLAADPATLNKLGNGNLDVPYLAELLASRPDVPDPKTLAYHEEQLAWDYQRFTSLTGPGAAWLEAVQKGESPERVRALAVAIAESFNGWSDRRYLHDPQQIVSELVGDLRLRQQGRAVYPFGIDGLDYVDPPSRPQHGYLPPLRDVDSRLIPGAAPGMVTVVTGISGSGKSTVTARIVLGQLRQRKRVLYGAWEMSGRVTLELLACMSLGLSRTNLMTGKFDDETLSKIEQQATALSKYVRFLANPFRRRSGEKASNERNLDLVAGYIADSGCDVFVADLWKRCLVDSKPEAEEEALYRQQAIGEELRIHTILVQQQRLKDIEARVDKRPTREGVKGSGTWVEVADNMLGVHRPALFKPVPDDTLEIDILKQRYGRWPLAVEFNWDADLGMISGGRTVTYEMIAASVAETQNPIDQKIGGAKQKGKWSR